MTTDAQPIEVSFTMADSDLFEMIMCSKSRWFGLSGRWLVKIYMGFIALAFTAMALVLPGLLGVTDDDPAKGPFQIGLVGAGLILTVLYPKYARWYTRRASVAYQSLPLPMKLIIDDAGIQAELDGQSGSTAWKLIERSVETETHVFLYLNRLRAYIIPKSSLLGISDLERLRALIASHVKTTART